MAKKEINVLYIDDEEAEYLIIKMLLKSIEFCQFNLVWKSSYAEGMEELLSNASAYDVCLTDYLLGAKNGLELIEQAVTEHCDIPIILLTGQGDHSIDHAAMEAGAADYISKDEVNGRILERTIRYTIEHKQNELELKKINQKIQMIAEYDQLTGLPNRNLFTKTLPIVLSRAERNNLIVALLFLDLDKFKDVNDTMGHDIGDELLKQVADRLMLLLRKTDIISRLGGDEFTIILEGAYDAPKIAMVAEKVINAIRPPFKLSEREVYITVSIGIATTIGCGTNPEFLLKCADTAMYSAKDKGRNNFQFYTEMLNQEVQDRVQIETDLRGALKRREFYLHYQPVVDLSTGQISAVEALLRWTTSDGRNISPYDFIPVAEDTGLINSIGEWVFVTACEQLKIWQDDLHLDPNFTVSINVSAKQLNDDNFINIVKNTFATTGITAKQIVMELTESAVMSDPEANIAILNELATLDVAISIDDFGTGYSSLAYLNCFPINTLKVDRAFVRDITEDPNDAIIVKAIIALAHNLGLQVVAEGVETTEQLEFIRANGCHYFQGYLFSCPVSSDELAEMLLQNKRLS